MTNFVRASKVDHDLLDEGREAGRMGAKRDMVVFTAMAGQKSGSARRGGGTPPLPGGPGGRKRPLLGGPQGEELP